MKTFLRVMLMLCLLGLVSGCSMNKAKQKEPEQQGIKHTMVCTKDEDGIRFSMTFESVDDKITKITQTRVIDISGYTKKERTAMQTTISEAVERYEGLEGVEYFAEIVEKTIEEQVIISTENAGLQNAITAGLITMSEADVDALSLIETRKSLEGAGWSVSEE